MKTPFYTFNNCEQERFFVVLNAPRHRSLWFWTIFGRAVVLGDLVFESVVGSFCCRFFGDVFAEDEVLDCE